MTTDLNETMPDPSVPQVERQTRRRERSEIGFPYEDLEAALGIARVAHEIHGGRCEADQVAAALDQSSRSGAFRMKLSAGRMFGVIGGGAQSVSVTELGSRALDEPTRAGALAEAFLKAPLYRALYERFRGRTLPADAGLAAAIRDLGVPEKQVDHARRVFQRSAQFAGFFAHGRDRLVMPPAIESGSATEAAEHRDDETNDRSRDRDDWMSTKPAIIAELFRKLPDDGQTFSPADRELWTAAFKANLDLVYGRGGTEENASEAR